MSCEERIAAGKNLTQAELDYLRTREAAKCISQSNTNFGDYEDTTNTRLVSYEAGRTWKMVYAKDGTDVETSYIYVWAVDGNNLYLRYKITEEGVLKNKFIKITTTSNSDMLRNLQEQYCAKTFDLFNLSSSSLTLTDNKNTRIFEATDTYVETDFEYKTTSADPLFFAVLNYSRTKKTFKTSTANTPTKTEKYTYTVTALTSTTTQPTSYTDSSITNRYYCGVNFSTPVAPDTRNDYAFPFALKCSSTTADQDTTGLDINGDGTIDFDPVTEL